jgi:hypothetical protein
MMVITAAKYILINEFNKIVKATIDEVEWSIPIDPANRHYQAILEWVEDGNTIEDAD